MAIYAYVGLPGAGKTYHAVADQIIPALRAGRNVVTNIPLREDALVEAGSVGTVVSVDTQAWADDPERTLAEHVSPGSVLVLDEVWRFLPQGMTAKNVPECWRSLFAEHRHRVDAEGRSMQIALVTQDLSQIAAFARALVERTVVVTKLTVVGASKRYRVDTYAGAVTGLKPPVSKRVGEEFGRYDPTIFACYVSHTMAERASGVVDERPLSGKGTVWRNPAVRFGVPLAGILMALAMWRLYAFFFGGEASTDAVSAPAPSVARVASPVRVSYRYRVSAVMRAEDDSESRVLLEWCDDRPAEWRAWHAARCVDLTTGGVRCEVDGERYVFSSAHGECKRSVERGDSKITLFGADVG